MKRIHFKEFVEDLGQADAAAALGCTQGAVSKALRVGREIFVIKKSDGEYEAQEVRPFPAQPAGKRLRLTQQ